MALVTTAGASNADSYVSLAEFAAYLAARLHVPAVVTAATTATREAALRMATRLFDARPCPVGSAIAGTPATETQALLFPMAGLVDRLGHAIPDDEVPAALKEAVSEYALQLMVADRTLDSEIETQGITKIKAGPVELGFSGVASAKVMPDAVRNLLVDSWCAATVASTASTTAIFEVL